MSTLSILDHAEARIAPATDQARTTRNEIIDAMRDEIGRQHYTQAKDQLPKLERTISEIYRPFLERVATIQAQSKVPLPLAVQPWLREMGMLCDTVPNTICAGIEGWDRLTPPIWTDGKSVDINMRTQLIGSLRQCLRNWDGVQGRLDDLTAQVERYIQESGWPAMRPTGGEQGA
ncbi:MAG: hypothetical protein E8D41_09925 [Nitrospira sp.]|nr:MAG: hypothetical protein E8D41_09925 [Nitrospira sp.]